MSTVNNRYVGELPYVEEDTFFIPIGLLTVPGIDLTVGTVLSQTGGDEHIRRQCDEGSGGCVVVRPLIPSQNVTDITEYQAITSTNTAHKPVSD